MNARWILGGGFVLGLMTAALMPAGCIIPDYCIMLRTAGRDYCRHIEGAMMWPLGHPELAEPVMQQFGNPPEGCKCFNVAEQAILTNKTPAEKFAALSAELEEPARNACHLLVPAGYDHNCYTIEGPDAPTFDEPLSGAPSEDCFGSCSYINPPPGKDCPDPPDPWACNENEGADSAGDDAGGETPPIDVGDSIECAGGTCLIDADWAQALWANPELLLADAARLVYDGSEGRFVFTTVEPGDVAHALGLRSGDVLLTINGLSIDGPEVGLLAYMENESTEVVDLTVRRDGREHGLRFEFVCP